MNITDHFNSRILDHSSNPFSELKYTQEVPTTQKLNQVALFTFPTMKECYSSLRRNLCCFCIGVPKSDQALLE